MKYCCTSISIAKVKNEKPKTAGPGKDRQTPECPGAHEGTGNSVAILKNRVAVVRNAKHETTVCDSLCVTHNCSFEHSLRGSTIYVHTET